MTIRNLFARSSRSLALAVAMAACGGGVHAAAEEMTFRPVVVSGVPGLSAVGQITAQTPAAFLASGAGRATRVYIDSPGGSVASAMRLGDLFRSRGVVAVVANVTGGDGDAALAGGNCFSACVYAVIGAARRVVPPQSRVGIHEMAPRADDPALLQRGGGRRLRADHAAMASALTSYAVRMGVGAGLIAAAEATPPGQLRVLSQREMRNWRFAVPRL